MRSATGFCAQEPSVVHFGAKAGKAYTAKVLFPGGAATSVAVKAGQFVKVVITSYSIHYTKLYEVSVW